MDSGRMLSRLLLIFFLAVVEGRMSSWECSPVGDINLSKSHGYGRFEEFVSVATSNTPSSAAITCSISGKEDALQVEWILTGEPPSVLEFDAGNELESSLHGSTVTCDASDIPDINRLEPSSEKSFIHGTGNVTYRCDGADLDIVFNGMNMLSQDLTKLLGTGGNSVDGCISESKMPKGELPSLIGHACNMGRRYMYDEEGNFTCAFCCADHYWRKDRNQCQTCNGVMTNLHPNVWTSCKDPREDLQTSAAETTSISSTPEAIPSLSAPEDVTISNVKATSVTINWKHSTPELVDRYDVKVQNEISSTNLTWMEVLNLVAYTKYEITIRATNKAELSPWTKPYGIKTKGTAPKRSPTNVTISCNDHSFNISWDPIVGTQSGGEEQILGVKIKYRLTHEGLEKEKTKDSKSSFEVIKIEEDGTYDITLLAYNEYGDGPIVSTEKYCGVEAEPLSDAATFGFICLYIAVEFIIIAICHCIRK